MQDQGFAVRLDNGSGEAVSIFERNLVGQSRNSGDKNDQRDKAGKLAHTSLHQDCAISSYLGERGCTNDQTITSNAAQRILWLRIDLQIAAVAIVGNRHADHVMFSIEDRLSGFAAERIRRAGGLAVNLHSEFSPPRMVTAFMLSKMHLE